MQQYQADFEIDRGGEGGAFCMWDKGGLFACTIEGRAFAWGWGGAVLSGDNFKSCRCGYEGKRSLKMKIEVR